MTSQENKSFACSECGKVHEDWPALVYLSPVHYDELSDSERQQRLAKLTNDFCELEVDGRTVHFIRVVLHQKVTDGPESLDYGLWVSLSDESHADYRRNFDNPSHEAEYFGWLCNNIPPYENTMSVPTLAVKQPGNQRPVILPDPNFDHPFVHDFYQGISSHEAQRRVDEMFASLQSKPK